MGERERERERGREGAGTDVRACLQPEITGPSVSRGNLVRAEPSNMLPVSAGLG